MWPFVRTHFCSAQNEGERRSGWPYNNDTGNTVFTAARGEDRRQLESQRRDVVVHVDEDRNVAKFDRIVSGCVTPKRNSVTNPILRSEQLDFKLSHFITILI